jgi:chaperonin cofactor prefoldin
MLDLTDVTSIVALIISILAYQRTGGTADLRKKIQSTVPPDDLKKQVERLEVMTDTLREKTADALERLEKVIRKAEKGE